MQQVFMKRPYIFNIFTIKVKVKIKFTLEQATKAHRGE